MTVSRDSSSAPGLSPAFLAYSQSTVQLYDNNVHGESPRPQNVTAAKLCPCCTPIEHSSRENAQACCTGTHQEHTREPLSRFQANQLAKTRRRTQQHFGAQICYLTDRTQNQKRCGFPTYSMLLVAYALLPPHRSHRGHQRTKHRVWILFREKLQLWGRPLC